MQRLLLLLSCFCCSFFAQAQQAPPEGCGTQTTAETIEWIRAHRFSEGDFSQLRNTLYLPIQFHIVGTDEGTGYFSSTEVFRLLCELNEFYTFSGMQFYIDNPFNYIAEDDDFSHSFPDAVEMMDDHNVNDQVNVYIVESPGGNCGWYLGNVDGVAIAKSCAGNNSTTLAHELGHFFSLPHTFWGWEGRYDEENNLTEPLPVNEREKVSGANCGDTGDGFCDTPPDYISYRWGCPFGTNLTDPDGVQFKPDETYFMSYSSDQCQDKFSNEQMLAMRTDVIEERPDMANYPTPNIDAPGTTELFYPANGANNVNADNVLFTWKNVNADRYYLEVTQQGSVDLVVNEWLTTTSYLANLSSNRTYYWKVIALNTGNTCGTVKSGSFQTGNAGTIYANTVTVQTPSCNGNADAGITLSVSGGIGPFNYAWSNGSTSNNISGLSAGIYEVTVTALDGETNVLSVNVPQTQVLNASVVQTENFTAQLSITGGTPTYTVLWENGAMGTNPTNLPVGLNTATIVDANGCTTTETVNIIAIQADVTPIVCHGDVAAIALTLAGGATPYTYEWLTGATTAAISNLEEGLYTVTITDADDYETVLTYNIVDPAPLEGSIVVNGSTAIAIIEGGVGPYNFYWPTGPSTSNSVSFLPPSTYEVFVYDANGCTRSFNFTVTGSVGIGQPNAHGDVQVFPTVLQTPNTLQLSGNSLTPEFRATLYSANGQVVQQWATQSVGAQGASLPLNQLSSGLYFLHLSNEQGVFNP